MAPGNRWIAGLAFVACACACLPASASGAGPVDNRAATREYLRAVVVYLQAENESIRAGVASIEARARRIAAECPGALTYAPRDEAFGEVTEAAAISLFFAGLEPARPVLRRFAREISHLTWTNRAITRLVRARANEEWAYAGLELPDVCADVAAWRASSYATLPPSVGAFVMRLHALFSSALVGPSEEPREQLILRLLRRYEGPRSRRAAKWIEAREMRSGAPLETAAAAARKALAAGLGVASL